MASNSDKSANSFMPLYGGDYLRDTMHLSAAEDGIYLRFLMHYWHSQRPLPVDQRKLEGIARVQDDAERAALKSVLAEFFPRDGDVRRNRRMDHEIAHWRLIRDKKIMAGKLGGERSAKSRAAHQASLDRSSSIAEADLKQPSSIAEADLKPAVAVAVAVNTAKAKAAATAKQVAGEEPPAPPKPSATAAPRGANGVAVWESYATAFKARYKVEPVRNAKVNSQIEQLVKRLGAEEAPAVATFYLSHNSPAYIHRGHSVGMLLLDAEKLRTEWASGRKITSAEARGAEQRDSVSEQARRVSERMDMKHGQQ